MKLLKIQRTDSYVRFSHEAKGPTIKANDPKNPGTTKEHVSTEERVVTAHEAPLKSFDTALQALADVVANILEAGQEWKKGVKIIALSLSYTKTGVRSAAITFAKTLEATGEAHQMATPLFQIDDGATPSEGRRQCSKKHAEAVAVMIREAEKYAEGERQQTMLKFGSDEDGDNDEGGEGGDVLNFQGNGANGSGPAAAVAESPKKTRAKRT